MIDSSPSSRRLFVAFGPPEALAARVDHAIAQASAAELPRARWVRSTEAEASRLHCTLRFLGSQPESMTGRLPEHLAEIVSAHSPMEVAMEGLGAFPARGKPRVLWLGLDAPPELSQLQAELDRMLTREIGLEGERRAFHPHLTVARCRELWSRRDVESCREHFRSIAGSRFRIDRLTLIESELRPEGARYHSLADLYLGGRAP